MWCTCHTTLSPPLLNPICQASATNLSHFTQMSGVIATVVLWPTLCMAAKSCAPSPPPRSNHSAMLRLGRCTPSTLRAHTMTSCSLLSLQWVSMACCALVSWSGWTTSLYKTTVRSSNDPQWHCHQTGFPVTKPQSRPVLWRKLGRGAVLRCWLWRLIPKWPQNTSESRFPRKPGISDFILFLKQPQNILEIQFLGFLGNSESIPFLNDLGTLRKFGFLDFSDSLETRNPEQRN